MENKKNVAGRNDRRGGATAFQKDLFVSFQCVLFVVFEELE